MGSRAASAHKCSGSWVFAKFVPVVFPNVSADQGKSRLLLVRLDMSRLRRFRSSGPIYQGALGKIRTCATGSGGRYSIP